MNDAISIKRALVSVSNKTDLISFVRRLVKHGVQIISTGGTARALEVAGIEVTPVDQVTDFPEMMDGRVKTLHPRIHGGLLALRDNQTHTRAMSEHGIEPIDLVCVNLYPFEDTIVRPGVANEEAIEQIDIGGPSMIRSAAKNHRFVVVVTDPSQYEIVADQIDANEGATQLSLRTQLAASAFGRTASYDSAITTWMNRQCANTDQPTSLFPDPLVLSLKRKEILRYGENPHQSAALYALSDSVEASVVAANQLHGKELSFNNLNDAAAALELVKEFEETAAAVIKHTNPCGLAVGHQLADVFDRAYAGDPLAAFGGIVAVNKCVDLETANLMVTPTPGGTARFLEVVLAPDFDDEALEVLRGRWKNVRLLSVGPLSLGGKRNNRQIDLKGIVGGVLAQQADAVDMSSGSWQHAAGPAPNNDTMKNLHLAWCAAKHVKSNAIVIARNSAVAGAGAGQMDRVESCKLAVAKANAQGPNRSKGAVAASDAFFPFRDGPDVLIAAGVIAIVQPGGSKRDEETLTACNEAGVSLLLTGRRHFRH